MKNERNKKLYIGFDLSSKSIEIFVRQADLETGKGLQIKNSKSILRKFLESLPNPTETVIALETGFDSVRQEVV